MAFWNDRKPFGRKGATPAAPPPPPPADPEQVLPAGPAPGPFGRAMCALTYRGAPSSAAVLGPLFADTLQDLLDGEPPGDLNHGAKLLRTRWGAVALLYLDKPIPLPGPTDSHAQLMYWPGWRDSAVRWGSHAILAAFDEPATLEEARAAAEGVLRVAAVMAGTTPAEGVNWMNTPVFHSASSFVELCARRALPMQVVVQPHFYGGGRDGEELAGACTRGLILFGLPEVDCEPGRMTFQDAYNRLMNIAAYLLDNGAVFRDGDTLGIDEAVQSRVFHATDGDGRHRLRVV